MGLKNGSALDLPQMATPGTPIAARQLLYFKSDGKLYTKDSAAVETLLGPTAASTMPRMRAQKTATWTLVTNGWNLVTGWTSQYDTSSAFDGTYYTVPSDGVYFLSASSGEIVAGAGAGRRVLNIEIGGSGVGPGTGTIIIGTESIPGTPQVDLACATDYQLTTSQQVRICIYDTAGTNQSVTAGNRPSVFTVRRVA